MWAGVWGLGTGQMARWQASHSPSPQGWPGTESLPVEGALSQAYMGHGLLRDEGSQAWFLWVEWILGPSQPQTRADIPNLARYMGIWCL